MNTASTLIAAVRESGLLAADRPVVVLLSGGRDSSCLLDVAVTIAGPANVYAFHVDYGLRATSGRDAEHCSQLCDRLEVALTIDAVTGGTPATNVQAWARERRYRGARELASRLPAPTVDIATGHTATDQVEGILYRLISSPSRRALLGMRDRDHDLIRPLLAVSREQTGAYCRERGIAWVDDESNDSPKYVRNRIRNELVPLLSELHPGAGRNLLALARILADEYRLLEQLVDDELAAAGPGRPAEIGLERLRTLPDALARMVVQRLADQVWDRPAPGVTRRLEELRALPDGGSAHVDLPGRVRATSRSGRLSFGPTDVKPRDATPTPYTQRP